jgi:hypothetical protein
MSRWQRRTTYATLGLCAASGIVWFVVLDLLERPPSTARPWWILHGITAVVSALVIGGAIVQHTIVTWRARRGRWSGACNLAALGLLLSTALYLMYGAEAGHDAVHWVHCIVGIAAIFVFAWHIVWGRTRVPVMHHATGK